ncbi:MAG TPA: C40 family peptidase [Solirubrobacteraceae bacterium]
MAAFVLAAACPGAAMATPSDATAGLFAVPQAPPTATAVSAALSKVGASYASGAAGPDAFDCSGLTMWALARAGIAAPHSSFAQYALGSAVSRADIRRGDLVFFDSFGAGASHVGLAISPTTAVSATSHGVMTHPIFDAYWGGHYVGARRLG